MPKTQSASKTAPGAPGKAGQKGKKGGGLVGLVKRKPLETIGAAAGVAVIGLALWKRHQGAGGQDAPGGKSYLAPPAPRTGGGQGGNYQGQINSLQRQLDHLDQARRRRRGGDHDRDDRRRGRPRQRPAAPQDQRHAAPQDGSPLMAWSIFSEGGGQGAALTWAEDLLQEIGAPLSPGNEQFVYDWEVSEGGGGAYNPLNQGPVPGHPELTTSGSQYGGGAADFAGWDAGLRGAADYLSMGNFTEIRANLVADDPAGARAALIASPWAASHYGNGSAFSTEPAPGRASALPPYKAGKGGFDWNPLSWPGKLAGGAVSSVTGPLVSEAKNLAIIVPLVLAGAALIVLGAYRASHAGQKIRTAGGQAAEAAGTAAVAA